MDAMRKVLAANGLEGIMVFGEVRGRREGVVQRFVALPLP